MTANATTAQSERLDIRTILTAGVSLGLVTVAGVAVFALLSRALTGRIETLVQSLIVLVVGPAAAYLPARWIRPQSVDAIGWSTLTGLLGAVAFTVLDTVLLRPLRLYHWTWDAIGGGSGWWYIPVWLMGSAFLAWMGALAYSYRARGGAEVNPVALGVQAGGVAVILFGVLAGTGLAPFTSAVAALALTVSVVVQVPIAAVLNRR